MSNLKILDVVEIYNTDYKNAIDKFALNNRKFDIIFIDPPYSKGIAQDALDRIEKSGIIADEGTVIVEHEEKDAMPDHKGKLILTDQRKYGGTKLSFYSCNNSFSNIGRSKFENRYLSGKL
ncbi:hypothetical protein SDC9_177595 [bioreactor metagenome]|uniref:Uncharacterized protein n=1 Tax=bioreactor metagenome TaxID=1076179 RepID=A0A645GTJ3_9ZZZZ